ncbi:hypothetical protein KP79_PYT14504 [Mizuhopecten yessoensis]|uniref:Uncharacterized protein n=1 Tax=Mizuhopecten yessoensis TaxID=6573 RepID=A0A210R2G4_MIZYE|nr:hypothetical protein KP79_PYT14504 [Mizuhopecten yessoensis]
MEPTPASPPKKRGCRIRILKEDTIDNLIKGRCIAVQIKRLIKDRQWCESFQLQLMVKQNRHSTSKILDEASNYPLFGGFKKQYEAYLERSVIRQQDIVTGLGHGEGPYEMVKSWLDDPTTKTKPEELKKQYSNLRDDHASKITLLKKEEKTLAKICEQLTSCQKKLRNVQTALRVTFGLDVDVSAREIKEHRTLRNLEKELISRLDKSLRQCQAMMIEENESRKQLQKGMARIAAEVESFDKERVKACNAAMNCFVRVLNQHEMQRTEKTRAKCDLLATISPTFMASPNVSLNNKDTAFIYRFPDFAEQLREMGFSDTGSALDSVYKPVEGSHNTSNTLQNIASKSYSPQVTKYCLNSSSSSDDLNDTDGSEQKARNRSKTTPRNVPNKKLKEGFVEEDEKKQQKQATKFRNAGKQNDNSAIQKLVRKTSPQPVEHEEEPTRKLTKPTQNRASEDEDDAPPRLVSSDEEELEEIVVGEEEEVEEEEEVVVEGEKEVVMDEAEEEEEDVSVKDNEQEKSRSEVSPSFDHGIPLEQSCLFKALVTHTSFDDSDLNFEKGQRLVQTHQASEEDIAYGYIRKHRYSQLQYGYFNIRQTRLWEPSTKNVFKKLFTSI